MLDFLRRLLGGKPAASPSSAKTRSQARAKKQFDTLNQLAPLKKKSSKSTSAKVAASSAEVGEVVQETLSASNASFVCREPVLDRKEHIAGYIFDLQEGLRLRLQGREDMLYRAYDDALLRSLATLSIHSLLGHRLAFVNLTPASLSNPLIFQLPPENTVLMLRPGKQPLDAEKLHLQCKALHKAGFAYGWILSKKHLAAHHPTLAQLVVQGSYVQLQSGDFDGREIDNLRKALTSRRTLQQGKLYLLANELHSFDEFNLCFESGFDFFMGSFITSRENWHPPKSDINRVLAIKLLNQLRGDGELNTIASQITADPVMTYKLLRYLNSPAIGLQNPVLTIDKALMILGRERCYRWLSLLLFDIKQTGFRERLLTEQALTRAFFLESLAGIGKVPNRKDELFILGLFSMLDLLIGSPLPELLAQTQLPDNICQALLGQPGIYHIALELAKASDTQRPNDPNHTGKLAAACGVNALQILERSILALDKAHTTMTLSEA